MLKAMITVVVLFLGLSLGGCNTMAGLGEDMQALGRTLSGEAEEEKEY